MPKTLGFLFPSAFSQLLQMRLQLKLATMRINGHSRHGREEAGASPRAPALRNLGSEISDRDILKYLPLVSFQHFCYFCYLKIKLGGRVIHH